MRKSYQEKERTRKCVINMHRDKSSWSRLSWFPSLHNNWVKYRRLLLLRTLDIMIYWLLRYIMVYCIYCLLRYMMYCIYYLLRSIMVYCIYWLLRYIMMYCIYCLLRYVMMYCINCLWRYMMYCLYCLLWYIYTIQIPLITSTGNLY